MFLKFIIMIMIMIMVTTTTTIVHVGVTSVPPPTCRRQGQLYAVGSLHLYEVPGIKLRLSGLRGKCLSSLSHLAGPVVFMIILTLS